MPRLALGSRHSLPPIKNIGLTERRSLSALCGGIAALARLQQVWFMEVAGFEAYPCEALRTVSARFLAFGKASMAV